MLLRKILPAANQHPAEMDDLSPTCKLDLNCTSPNTFFPYLSQLRPLPLHSPSSRSPLPPSQWPPLARSPGWSPTAGPPSCRSARPQTSLPRHPAQQPQRDPLSPVSVCPRRSAGIRARSLLSTRLASTSSWLRSSAACTSCWSSFSAHRKSLFQQPLGGQAHVRRINQGPLDLTDTRPFYTLVTLSSTRSRRVPSPPGSAVSTLCVATPPARSVALPASSARPSALPRLLQLRRRSVRTEAAGRPVTISI